MYLENKNRRFQFTLSKNYRLRSRFILIIIGSSFLLLLSRYAYLSLIPNATRNALLSRASSQFATDLVLAPPRAKITDRNGKTLATTVLVPSIFVVPKKLPKNQDTLKLVSKTFNIPLQDLKKLGKSNKGFAWLRRQMDIDEFKNLPSLGIWSDFIGVLEEPKRIYPERNIASHLVGVVGTDNVGLEGVEKRYDELLKGEAVVARVSRDARGRQTLILPNGAVKPAPQSADLSLSIDIVIQSITENALRRGVREAHAKGGSAVVMDPNTGEILSIASYPTYDLNRPTQEPESRRFRPIMDALELGSVVKPLFVAAALDKGLITKETKLDCENGKFQIPGGAIHDDHPHKVLSIAEVIKYSSNICTYKITQKLGRLLFYDFLFKSGLSRYPGTGLPGEWGGRVTAPDNWREMRFANMSFGQGIAVSPLQLTRAIATLVNGGIDHGVKILAQKSEQTASVYPRHQVFSEQTSKVVTQMMRGVVEEDGTGKKSAIPGFAVAGKTGTAEKFDVKLKQYSERIASFVGTVPADQPRLVITVVIDEPQVRPAYGGKLAGPVFAEIGRQALNYLNSTGKLTVSGSIFDSSAN